MYIENRMLLKKPTSAFKHIAWSHKPTHDQNQPKSLSAPTRNQMEEKARNANRRRL